MRRNGFRRRAAAARVVGALALGVAAVVLASAPPASAHNVLRSSSPADGAEVDVPPESVSLVFDEPAIALGTVIEVTASDGTVVSQGEPELVDTSVRQPISAQAAGEYRVVWRVTSSDGHPIEGELGFTVATAPEPAVTSSGRASPTAERSDTAEGSSTAGVSDDVGVAPTESEADGAPESSSRPVLPWLLGAGAMLALGAGLWFLLRRRARDSSAAQG